MSKFKNEIKTADVNLKDQVEIIELPQPLKVGKKTQVLEVEMRTNLEWEEYAIFSNEAIRSRTLGTEYKFSDPLKKVVMGVIDDWNLDIDVNEKNIETYIKGGNLMALSNYLMAANRSVADEIKKKKGK